MRGVVAFCCSCLLLAGCLFPSDADQLGDRDTPALYPLATDPAPGAEGVSRNPTIRFLFNGRVHPDALGADTLYVTTGTAVARSARRVDLLDCSAELRPQDTLRPGLLYRAVARDLVSMTGGSQSAPVELFFVTGDATETPPPQAPPTLSTLVTEIFAPRCASCHSGFQAPAGLDLSTEPAAWATLVGQESLYQPGVRRVAPGSHPRSYLLWKLLDLRGAWGDPMPPSQTPAWPWDRACGTQDPDLRRIAAWVDSLGDTSDSH